jgi:hypothetical protein
LRLDVLGPEPSVQLFAERFTARGGSWSAERDTATSRVIVDALGGLPLWKKPCSICIVRLDQRSWRASSCKPRAYWETFDTS